MSAKDREIWGAMLRHLRATSAPECRQWFEELEPVGIDRHVLSLRAHTDVHRDYLRGRCSGVFKEAAQAVTGMLLSVVFLGPEEELGLPARQGTGGATLEAKPSAGLIMPRPGLYADGLPLNPDYGLDNFIVGPGNRLAHAAATAIAATPGEAFNPFFVHGGVGLGKTHLLQAICLQIHGQRPDAQIYFTSCEGFLTQYVEAVRTNDMAQFRHKFRDVDVLVVDDIHFLTRRERTQEEFFHTFNSLFQAKKQIVLSSDAPPGEIPDLEERLVSRFKWGLVTSVERPEYETRVAILKDKGRMRGVEMTDEAIDYIAGRIDSNIRELEGAVVKVQAIARAYGRPADITVARQALGDDPGKPERQVQMQAIVGVVTEYYGVKLTDLQGKRRHRSIALPRQVCMSLARQLTRYSLTEIGGYFGGRDHTTVMHAVSSVNGRCTTDSEFATLIKALGERARGNLSVPNGGTAAA